MAEEKKYVYVRAPIFDSQGKVDEREQRFRGAQVSVGGGLA